MFKANVDGAVFAELNAVGIGVVIRDMDRGGKWAGWVINGLSV